MDKIIEYAPIIIVILVFFLQQKIFITPEQLEKKHREILNDIDNKYETKVTVGELKAQMRDVAMKVDKIYNILLKNNK